MTVLLCFQVAAFAQITTSVYTGVGLSTFFGGRTGVGFDFQYKQLSANAAIGIASINNFRTAKCYLGNNPNFGFDVGLKYFVYKGLFCGLNYGVLLKEYYSTNNPNVWNVKNRYGFSFVMGYKWHFDKRVYGITYMGTTSEKDVQRFFNLYIPVFGFIIGYNFISNEKPLVSN